MPRPRLVERPVKVTIYLPEKVNERLNDAVYSKVEGCVPKGALSGFVTDMLRRYFESIDRAAANTTEEISS
jgi:hypothetical protein